MIEDLILKTSGILTWSQNNIEQTPESVGVYVLRETPINGFVIEVDMTENLKKKLEELKANGFRANFFSWYETKDSEDAKKVLEDLALKYQSSHH